MNQVILFQFKTLVVFLITGLAIGFLFDFFRIQRKIIKTNNIITYIQDSLFWAISGLILIIIIMNFTDGEIRSYMILGFIIGIIIYFYFFSKLIRNISVKIIKYIIKVLKIILWPFKKLYIISNKILKRIISIFQKKEKNIKNV